MPPPPLLASLRTLHSYLFAPTSSSTSTRSRTQDHDGAAAAGGTANASSLALRLADVVSRTWDLGFTAFGGPSVHFQILHRRFVEGRDGGDGNGAWVDEAAVSVSLFLFLFLPLCLSFVVRRGISSVSVVCSIEVRPESTNDDSMLDG